MAPVPKPAGQRRRRNKDIPATVTLEPAAAARTIPKLPARPPCEGAKATWSAETRAWWARVWASPLAALYVADVDVEPLVRLAVLREETRRPGLSRTLYLSMSAEARLLEDRFGMSAISRIRLRAELKIGDDTAKSPPAPAAAEEDGRFLRAIEGGKK